MHFPCLDLLLLLSAESEQPWGTEFGESSWGFCDFSTALLIQKSCTGLNICWEKNQLNEVI